MKRQKWAMILAVILALLLIVPFIVSAFTASAASNSALDRLKGKASELTKQKNGIQSELAEISADKTKAMKQKQILDRQIDIAEQEIETTKEIITELENQIKVKEVELAQAIEDEKAEMVRYKDRVRAMEESGSASYIGILVQADSYEDLLGRAEMVGDLLDYNQEIIQDLKVARDKVAEAKTGLESDKVEQNETKATLETRKADLEVQQEKSDKFVEALEKEEKSYKAALIEAQASEERLDKEIKTLLAKLEAERKAKEAARREAERKSGTSSGTSSGTRVGTGGFAWPLPGYTNVSSGFGMRYHPTLKVTKLHTGTDIPAPTGTIIKSSKAGTVVTAGYNSGYGNYVVIDHDDGTATLYGHMSKILCKSGQSVGKLATIGAVGSTGFSTGPHLHFEIIIGGQQVNAMKYF